MVEAEAEAEAEAEEAEAEAEAGTREGMGSEEETRMEISRSEYMSEGVIRLLFVLDLPPRVL